MTETERELLGVKLWEYIQTPEGKEFPKRFEEYEKTLNEMIDILGASPYSEGEELVRFNQLYGEFRKTEEGKYYDEYFTKVNDELYELTIRFGIYSQEVF